MRILKGKWVTLSSIDIFLDLFFAFYKLLVNRRTITFYWQATLNTTPRLWPTFLLHELLILVQHIKVVIFDSTGTNTNPLKKRLGMRTRLGTSTTIIRFHNFSKKILYTWQYLISSRSILHWFETKWLMTNMIFFLIFNTTSIKHFFLFLMLLCIGMIGTNKLLCFWDMNDRFTLLWMEIIIM